MKILKWWLMAYNILKWDAANKTVQRSCKIQIVRSPTGLLGLLRKFVGYQNSQNRCFALWTPNVFLIDASLLYDFPCIRQICSEDAQSHQLKMVVLAGACLHFKNARLQFFLNWSNRSSTHFRVLEVEEVANESLKFAEEQQCEDNFEDTFA